MEEIWRDIKNYEGLYQVSNLGRVKSLARLDYSNHLRKEKILKPRTNKDNYFDVKLCKEGIAKRFLSHRLVAEAFIPNPNNYPQVNHKTENPSRNFVYINEDGTVDLEKSELEWCTNEYNSNYGTRNKRVAEAHKGKKHSEKSVLQIDPVTNEVIAEFPSGRAVQRQLGFSQSHISACCLKKQKTCRGYIWRYKNER